MPFTKTAFVGAILAMSHMSSAKEFINGVYYCNEVTKMQYTNVGCSGSFKTPSNMNADGCSVDLTERTYGGPLAPLNEEITFHLRGPLRLYNFAAYYIDNSDAEDEEDGAGDYNKREVHNNHKRHHHHEKRDKPYQNIKTETEVVEEIVTLTKYVDPEPTTSAAAAYNVVANAYKSNSKKPKRPKGGDVWKRTGFYDAGKQKAEGIVFLNNKGGQGSGKWSSCFGNSLSYMSADATDGASSPQILADGVTVGVNQEYSIWTNQTCDGSCGYAYGQDVCYKGFNGDNKVFVFKFTMPTMDNGDGSIYGNNNMPAIWSLNSLIGRTQQYPADKSWSCWDTGCGEFDIWEVLYPQSPACEYMTSTLHSAQGASGTGKGGGGTCDYFKRPTDGTFTGMVSYLSDGTITIQKLSDDFKFPEYITSKDIKKGFSADMPNFKVNS